MPVNEREQKQKECLGHNSKITYTDEILKKNNNHYTSGLFLSVFSELLSDVLEIRKEELCGRCKMAGRSGTTGFRNTTSSEVVIIDVLGSGVGLGGFLRSKVP